MMRFLIAGVLVVAGCSSTPPATAGLATPSAGSTPLPTASATPAPTPTAAPTPISGDAFAAALAKSGIPTTDVIVYTADTDQNKLLGRPGQYVGKVNWTDVRAPAQKQQATVVIFADDASMQTRFGYLDGILKSSPLFLQYMYRSDARRLIIRVPKQLTPAQAGEYEIWLKTV